MLRRRQYWLPLGLTTIVLLLDLFSALRPVQADTPPHRFNGSAFLHAVIAANATITGLVNDVVCGTTTANSNGEFRLDVLSWEDRIGCAVNGSLVRFTVNGLPATELSVWEMGGFTSLNLRVPATGIPDTFTISGAATVNGQPAANTLINAFVGGILCGSTMTDVTGAFRLTIAGSSIRAGCGTPGAGITFASGGQTAAQVVGFQSGGRQVLNLSFGGAALWLNGPPGTGLPACPGAGQWLFLYWVGAEGTSIDTAAAACPNVDRIWTNRVGVWFAFSPGSPASDVWTVSTGEGYFLRGRSQ